MTETPNIHLTKDAPEEFYSVERVNANSDRIDAFAGSVTAALAGKQDVLTFDTTPTAGSEKPVTSGGIYIAMNAKVETSTYATDKAAIDAKIATIIPAAIKAVDEVSKNRFDINATPTVNHTTYSLTDGVLTVTSNGIWANYNVPVYLPAGDYVFSAVISNFSRASGAAVGTVRFRIAENTSGGTEIAGKTITENEKVEIPFSWTGGILYVQYYSNYSATSTYVNTFTASDSMICTAADLAVSQKFVPYCPTLYELYQMVLALQSGTRSLSMQPETLTKGATEMPGAEETETETESREEER